MAKLGSFDDAVGHEKYPPSYISYKDLWKRNTFQKKLLKFGESDESLTAEKIPPIIYKPRGPPKNETPSKKKQRSLANLPMGLTQ